MSVTCEEKPLPDTSTLFPHLHSNPATLPLSLNPFTITTTTGFLPLRPPRVDLPASFAALTNLVEKLPIVRQDGSPGLLANFQLGNTIDAGALPDLSDALDELIVQDGKPNLSSITTAFRDYAFLASAYLLEPCWEAWNANRETGYGLGRQVLPKCIARPLLKTAALIDIPPFMSYAAAYALYNYRYHDPAIGYSRYSNLRLIRAFEQGLDPRSSEAGFVLTHVDMVKHSPSLIQGVTRILDMIEESTRTPSLNNRDGVNQGFEILLSAMEKIEASMETMWSNSLPRDYNAYRTFIFGITSQSMFPNGVVYEGHNGNKPLFFRGESGANDSMIPLLDHLLEIPMPANPLTAILKDFRAYRPLPHRQFLSFVMNKATELGVAAYCRADPTTAILYLQLLDHVRSFRWRHWLFVREYILKRSKHPTATGGSPIVTWLPNQLLAVMDLMVDVYEGGLSRENGEFKRLQGMMDNVRKQRAKLEKEVQKWCQERGW
ncbi:hypothetical protein GJ744_000903 [Endocarpon pusillum]|uniref:Indoleamine 2,3-dioxygenase n=1 Tax=Endocarpon pusillum TaxID=364733 RepID=A0A8H7AR04_9EURO|nr:hypothetical protein GJ744_000903 [Endocarpon pusillum]